MPPVKPQFDPANLYFVTTTAAGHNHFFDREVIKRIIADSFRYLRQIKTLTLYAFVIMPNHIHFIARFPGEKSMSQVIQDFKKHTAHQIIRQFEVEEDHPRLGLMAKAAQEYKRQKYKVWERGYDAREVFSQDFLQQKMDYIHHNPCQDQWELVERPENYIWSSARFYLLDRPAIIDIDDVRELLV